MMIINPLIVMSTYFYILIVTHMLIEQKMIINLLIIPKI
jgi:hypothetical protein